MAPIQSEAFDYLFHHIFLPQKLPGHEDDSASNAAALISFVLRSLQRFLDESRPADQVATRSCISMLEMMQMSSDNYGSLDEDGLRKVLQDLSVSGTCHLSPLPRDSLTTISDSVAAFHVAAQNAGILIRRTGPTVCFETFELSPTNEAVTSTRGRLVRRFPATATEMSLNDFQDEGFQSALIKTLVKMSFQTAPDTRPTARKAGQDHTEERDSTNPRIVTELLTSILAAVGKHVSVQGICKNTRQEISWRQSRLPWRRSAVWLLIRVALQLTMSRQSDDSDRTYKDFMVYLMAQVLDAADHPSTPTYALHTMITKVSGRLCKLENPGQGPWLETIEKVVSDTSECLAQRWHRIRDRSETPLNLESVSRVDMKDNIDLSLPPMDDFLATLPQRRRESGSSGFIPTSYVPAPDPDHLPPAHVLSSNEHLLYNLAMVELWVATHLGPWLEKHIGDDTACRDLKLLLQRYHSAAVRWYKTRPEGISRMLLAISELWVAIDKAALHAIPMLREYDPEVPAQVWQVLLVASMEDMARLHRVETYVKKRQELSLKDRPSVFRSYGERLSFPVQYFEQSAKLKHLKSQIENQAEAQKRAKLVEFAKLREEHDRLMRQHEQRSCEKVEVDYHMEHVAAHCRKCSALRDAKNLEIEVYEWPLPNRHLQAQAVVFELAVPQEFAEWRDATIYLVDDVLGCKPSQTVRPRSAHPLRTYRALAGFRQSGLQGRIHLLSEAKPHAVTHRRSKRIAHTTESEFGSQMLASLTQCVSRVHENWESHTSLWCFTFLTSRLLSIGAEHLSKPLLGLLAQCRKISYKWLCRLMSRVQETTDDAQRQEFLETAFKIALICADTFDVDDRYLPKILADSQEASILLEASIGICNNSKIKDTTEDVVLDILYNRWMYTLHRARPVLIRDIVKNGNSCLDIAIHRSWPAFVADSEWTMTPSTCYWLETTSSRIGVHFSILTGELLVNGLPLSRLPREFELHTDYNRLFGSLSLDVMPSTLPGMQFCATRPIQGHSVHFGMQDIPGGRWKQDLVVRMEKDGSTLDLVPSRTFKGVLPHMFVEDYAHWHHGDTGVIELRQRANFWEASDDNWKLARHGASWRLSRHDKTYLLAPSSKLGERIATILRPLEASLDLHMLYDVQANLLDVHAPRLQLDFVLKCGESSISSRQYRGMQIDTDQSLGTLVGFNSKLILRSNHSPPSRLMILPEGEVRFEKSVANGFDEHVDAFVVHGTAQRVQAYRIDNLLGRLVANNKVDSKLFLAYIHALTSFCLPDPFLGRTGTEQALDILTSASVRAPSQLTKIAHERLGLIADISPSRSFYGEKSMQIVDWYPELSCLTQDDRFYTAVHEILKRTKDVDFLFPKGDFEPIEPNHAEMELVNRAILQSSRHKVSGFGAETYSTQHDVEYQARDKGQESRPATRAGEMAFRIYHNETARFQPVSHHLETHLYGLLETEQIGLFTQEAPTSKLNYDSRWLENPKTFLSSDWCGIHYAFQNNNTLLNKFELMVWIATMSFATDYDAQIVQSFLMLATSPTLSAVSLPDDTTYDLSKGHKAVVNELTRIATDASISFKQSPDANLPQKQRESLKATVKRRQRSFADAKTRAIEQFRRHVGQQWPCETPTAPKGDEVETYINIPHAMDTLMDKWKLWYRNLMFKVYLMNFVSGLDDLPFKEARPVPGPIPLRFTPKTSTRGFVSIDDLFSQGSIEAQILVHIQDPTLDGLLRTTTTSAETSQKLTEVLDSLDNKTTLVYEHHYVRELRQSLESLRDHVENELDADRLSKHASLFQQHLEQCGSRVKSIYDSLLSAVMSVSPILFLQQLRMLRWWRLSDQWRNVIIEYALAVTALQQAKRFLKFQDSPVDLLRELENTGQKGWNAHEHPEWLLLECESEIMIREVQEQIAQQMMAPPDKQNAVMQLNMGEGKSTVIVPIVSSALGDGSKLVRVIVAKPQAKQMNQMLVSKLSGLLDRPVYQLPFSREIRMDTLRAGVIHGLMVKCMEEGGVLMVQPEHLLSFQLMEPECQLNANGTASEQMMKTRIFFDKFSRDIVDESDENFSVKFELIYTLGQQRSIEHSPDRWIVVQEVLGLIAKFCGESRFEFPQSIDFDDRHVERFPRIRLLRPDAQQAVLNRVAEYICETGMSGFPIAHQPPKIREAVRRYITQWELSPEEVESVEQSLFWGETTMNHILLLRGLLSGGILSFALGQKRWRVNYGTDPHRETKTLLAVPYRAKDNPTPRSEFSHPDVVIVLTCLSYYYSGLDDEALYSAFDLLTNSDNADLEYQVWVKNAPTLPEHFRHLEGINLRDRLQSTTEVFPHLRYSKAAIDYYLCRLVFAKECKEFPHKLSASGWDLAKIKTNPTTGFSGTNDSRYLLPMAIKQLDLVEQKHTNALVLEYLLRPENGIALMPPEMKGATFDSQTLLEMVSKMSPNTRVILDVGAQVIDLTNIEFAKAWLSRYDDENTQAVICFSELDDIIVVDRSGKVEELQTSPFANQMDQCLVFLDEAHTRGTDLKLPVNYQAVVTLGAGLTKDRLVQACMRMRKLGKGQTVVFCIPREIEQKILLQRGQKPSSGQITISDVISWVITETCLDLRRAMPLWLTQGLRFFEQQGFWDGVSSAKTRFSWAQQFMEAEAQSLDQRYRPRRSDASLDTILGHVGPRASEQFRSRCEEFGLIELQTSSLNEEQERELSPEAQQERQVEKPARVEPETHRVHSGLREFIVDGQFPGECAAFKPAFKALSQTSAAACFDVNEFPSNIWVTHDFATTVKARFGKKNYSDSFQRPVQWILTSNSMVDDMRLVIISPFEAQELLSVIEASRHVTLRLYAPRTNLGFQPLDHLRLYTISKKVQNAPMPEDIIVQLNLFAGQLYLTSFDEYVNVCEALGLAWGPSDDSVTLGPDGFIPPGTSVGKLVNTSGFTKSPVRFLKVLMSKIRQDCELIEKTHMGKILEGIRLVEEDFADQQN
ncbi:uncharacterized protein NECHADRAFT_94047 [Fusarium vanettenii 77-13-4]|uniref:ubiquitinyl hydrolase 1 n=1 Tax=Fusarium vanettenii (strain ATCC MYA-4622 / CBS 123669 / FGSC 9596 / NRRL 45880 / 77-13-4) TaxID=660122 RepID=C7ZGG8_FUSV7|nr:uncharacterized protein NECHADRAFT_94047 [Fusarium vanettenii 77-13-4]EEU36845.1 hypothetical protein NECHADRAFT_94047 [Fusarium vanettenii 77-13-4]